MFSLNRRHWFAGLSALIASVALDRRDAHAAPEISTMPTAPVVFPNAESDAFAECDLIDINFHIIPPSWRGHSLWTPPLAHLIDIADATMAREWATVHQALERVVDLAPEVLAVDELGDVAQLSEAITNLFGSGWHRAIHLGYALAMRNAPAVLTVSTSVCETCMGSGRLWDGHRRRPEGAPAAAATVCETCGGEGVVDEAAAVAFHPQRHVGLPAWVPDPKGMSAEDWREALSRAEASHVRRVLDSRRTEANAA